MCVLITVQLQLWQYSPGALYYFPGLWPGWEVVCIEIVYMSAVTHYSSSIVYLFLGCSWSCFLSRPVCACVCKRGTSVCTCMYSLFSPLLCCSIATYLFSEDVLINLELTDLSVPLTLSSGLIQAGFRGHISYSDLAKQFIKPENYWFHLRCSNTALCTFLKEQFVWLSSILFSKGNCFFQRKQWDSQGEGMLCILATPCSVHIICATLMNYGWGHRSYHSALLHWPTYVEDAVQLKSDLSLLGNIIILSLH